MDATSSTCHARHFATVMVDCLNPFTATRKIAQPAEEETETDYIDSNLPDDSVDGLEQNNEDGGVPENLISGVGTKIETVYYFLF